MPNVNTGSIAVDILNSISPFPSNISGTLVTIVNKQVYRIEQFTGDSVTTSSIAEKYQPAVTDLSTAQVLRLMSVQDNGVQFVTVGDLSTNNKNLLEMAKSMEDQAWLELKSLSKGIKFYKARG